jgi:hypothetical protein
MCFGRLGYLQVVQKTTLQNLLKVKLCAILKYATQSNLSSVKARTSTQCSFVPLGQLTTYSYKKYIKNMNPDELLPYM